jgi:hypothetical protein
MKYKSQTTFRKLCAATGLFLLLASFSSAENALTPDEQLLMDNITQFRMELGACSSSDEAVARIDAMQASLSDGTLCPEASEEIQLSVDNILVWEKYNYLYEKDIKHPDIKPLITAQYAKIKKYFKTHPGVTYNKWLYETAADTLSCCMQFLPFTTALSEGLNVKKYYDDALAQDPDMVFALINVAQWYYYAPVINGGGKKKTLDCLKKAVSVAKNKTELYYAKAMLSQMLFENSDKTGAASLLSEDASALPGSRYIAHLQKINDAGCSYFYYTLNRAKVDAKMNAGK